MGCIVVYELKFYIVASRQIHSTIKEKLTKNQVGHFFRSRAYTRKGSLEVTFFRPYVRKFCEIFIYLFF